MFGDWVALPTGRQMNTSVHHGYAADKDSRSVAGRLLPGTEHQAGTWFISHAPIVLVANSNHAVNYVYRLAVIYAITIFLFGPSGVDTTLLINNPYVTRL